MEIIKRKLYYIIVPLIVIIFVLFLSAMNGSKTMDPGISKKITIISQNNIYFGHQSVGQNIISGLNKLNSKFGNNEIIIKNLSNISESQGNYFIHSNIGNNGDPKGKFKEFAEIVDSLTNKNLNIAMMKLCFVDFNKNTDIQDIFNSYVTMMDSLQKKYPNIIFIHFTVPLKSQLSWISKIKDLIKNRDKVDPLDNLRRNEYNKLIFSKYSKDYIFDLAGAESTYPDGKREFILLDDKISYTLINNYTTDGGHLNEEGENIIAAELINKIYNIIKLKNIKENQLSNLKTNSARLK
jgi:hypothetical protein